MKKYLLAAALVMVSASAMADRVVSASNAGGSGSASKASACEVAKENAARKASNGEVVEGYTRCDCDNSPALGWRCSVDAKLVKEN